MKKPITVSWVFMLIAVLALCSCNKKTAEAGNDEAETGTAETATVNFYFLENDVDPYYYEDGKIPYPYKTENINLDNFSKETIRLMHLYNGIKIKDIWYEGHSKLCVDLEPEEFHSFNAGSFAGRMRLHLLVMTLSSYPSVEEIEILIDGEKGREGDHFNFSGTFKTKKQTETIPHYYHGDTGPGGGIVFFYSDEGFVMLDTGEMCHYLEAAPFDMKELAWASSAYIPPDVGGTGANIGIPGTETKIGTGRMNTYFILNTDANAPAAKACAALMAGGKTDWFLPSKDELNELCNNGDFVGNLGNGWYWSSTQYDDYAGTAWSKLFETGYPDGNGKQQHYSVRAIRAF